MQVNDLIFKELLKRGYSLEGKTRVWNIADSKLWYLIPEQAQAYLDLDKDKLYKKFTGQSQWQQMIKENIKELNDEIGSGPINVIDLGCGDGTKTAFILKELLAFNPNLKMRYCPIDISGHMVSKAIETFSKLNFGEVVEFKWNISDFENLENITPLLRKGEFKKNVIFFLGNTLDNFEIHEILYAIKVAMDKEDLLVIDTAINDHNQESRVGTYEKSERFNEWLIHIPLQLGLSRNDVEFGGRFRNSRIEMYYTLKKDCKVSFLDKTVYFNKGDQIIVVVAYKYEREDMKGYLNMHFSDVSVKFSEDNAKILAVCKR